MTTTLTQVKMYTEHKTATGNGQQRKQNHFRDLISTMLPFSLWKHLLNNNGQH